MVLHSGLYRLFREAFANISVRLGFSVGWGRSAFPSFWTDHSSTRFRLLKFALVQMRSELDLARVPMMVVIYPDVTLISENNIYVEIYDRASLTLMDILGVPVYSGYAAFLKDKEGEENMTFSFTDAHPNCKAHHIFGEWVFRKFQEHFSVGAR